MRFHSSIALAASLAALISASCASPPVSGFRFKNRPIVTSVNDRVALSAAPRPRGFPRLRYYFDRFFYRRVARLTELERSRHALNVNALDEVPDSTWFTNRGPLDADAVRRGPNRSEGPSRAGKWTVTGTKVGGKSAGLNIVDADGTKFILKFDEPGFAEIETGANVIAQRILWASGFNVPEDDIVFFERSDLALAPDARIADTFGNKRAMKAADLDAVFERIDARPDGSYRGMASRFLDGVPLGGAPPEGVRDDDPNDIVAHQHRRELRGQYVVFSWLDHTDVKQDNTLDMLVTDEAGKRFVRHYLVDFGKALGTAGVVENRADDGFAFLIDFQYIVASAFGIGLWRRPWEGASAPKIRGVGRFESRRFHPNLWRPSYPWEPFLNRDRFDGYWGAKLVARFTPELVRAAIEAGRYSDPKAVDYLTRTLLERRDKILAYWFGRVSPLDAFRIEGSAVCFTDLSTLLGDNDRPRVMRYNARVYDYDGKRVASGDALDSRGSEQCLDLPAGPSKKSGYQIVSIRPTYDGIQRAPVEAHIARDGAGVARLIGLVRR